jgi:hypothetical protein
VSQNFHEQYSVETKVPTERGTGLVFAAIAALVAYWWRSYPVVLAIAAPLAGIFLATSLLAPSVLRPLNIVWFKFAIFLGKITNPIVMFMLFLIVIVPAGLIMQLKRDPLRKRRNTSATTYWIERSKGMPPNNMTNQF